MRCSSFPIKVFFGVVSLLLLITTAGFAEFPVRPIQILVGWPAGGVNDVIDRAMAKHLTKILKQPVIVQNVPGGGGSLVLGRVKVEKQDGHVLFQTGLFDFSQIPWTREVPYHPLKDFAYLAQYNRFEHYLVGRPDNPWNNFEEFIQYAKDNPKKVKFGSQGVGSTPHIMMEYLAMKENIEWTHIPYNSGNEAYASLMGKHIDVVGSTVGVEKEHIFAGRLRPIICFNAHRSIHFPDLPTVVEKGYDFNCYNASIFAVSSKTPKNVQKMLEKALLQAIEEPDIIETIKKLNLPYAPLNSQDLTKALLEDHQRYGEQMKRLGLGIFKK